MWYKCACKYCICDISAIVNERFIFTAVLMSHMTYLLTHLINSKYIINQNYYAMILFIVHGPHSVYGAVQEKTGLM